MDIVLDHFLQDESGTHALGYILFSFFSGAGIFASLLPTKTNQQKSIPEVKAAE